VSWHTPRRTPASSRFTSRTPFPLGDRPPLPPMPHRMLPVSSLRLLLALTLHRYTESNSIKVKPVALPHSIPVSGSSGVGRPSDEASDWEERLRQAGGLFFASLFAVRRCHPSVDRPDAAASWPFRAPVILRRPAAERISEGPATARRDGWRIRHASSLRLHRGLSSWDDKRPGGVVPYPDENSSVVPIDKPSAVSRLPGSTTSPPDAPPRIARFFPAASPRLNSPPLY